MPKMKSQGGIRKKIQVIKSGSTKIGHVGANHNSGKKSRDYSKRIPPFRLSGFHTR